MPTWLIALGIGVPLVCGVLSVLAAAVCVSSTAIQRTFARRVKAWEQELQEFRQQNEKDRVHVKGVLEECEDMLERSDRMRRSVAAKESKEKAKAQANGPQPGQMPLEAMDRDSQLAWARSRMGD